MTGTRSSDLRRAAAALALTACLAHADEVALRDGSQLSGTITAIGGDGAVTLRSPLATEALEVKGEAVKRVRFSDTGTAVGSGSGETRVDLTNGDLLPCRPLSLEGDTLSVATTWAGDIRVPRSALHTISPGMRDGEVLYSGTGSLDGWTSDRWATDSGDFISQGPGRISREMKLPEQFSLRFQLAWKNLPNLQTDFCATLDEDGQPTSRYYLQMNSGGLEIRRQSEDGRISPPLATSPFRPDEFPDRRVTVEVRVDRTRSNIYLFLNGKAGVRAIDRAREPLPGNAIAFNSRNSGEANHRISNLEIRTWDANGARHRSEERGDPKTDALIDIEDERYSGRLEAIRKGGKGLVFSFRSILDEAPLNVPADKVSTVFLANEPPVAAPRPLIVNLQGNGRLSIESCRFEGDHIEAKHPLLGPLVLKRTSVISIERTPQSNPNPEAAE